ncbi:MAG: transcriptional repressor [Verrucomicrobiae bacterium]|nr:transcriptional repressor [Verrucomicrobiae bacterium]
MVRQGKPQTTPVMDEETLRGSLSKSGLRLTGQRRLIYEAVARYNGHPVTEDVHRIVKAKMPSVSLATVYNGLEALVKAGEIAKLPREGPMPARYEIRKDIHHHARCVDCDLVWDLDAPSEPLPIQQLLGTHRFKALAARIEVLVECPVKTNTSLGRVPNAVCPFARSNRFKQRRSQKAHSTS